MKRALSVLLAATALAVALPAAAQPDRSINARQVALDQRIDMGVRNGALTRDEAARLRADFQTIAQIEANYRADGLSQAEVADLDHRFDLLNARIRVEANDRQASNGAGQWQSIAQRQQDLDRRIDLGVRNGALTRREADQLRAQFRQIAVVEANYRQGGLDQREIADLDRRFDLLNASIRVESNDSQQRGGRDQNFNQRQAELDHMIDKGQRDGALTQREANRLRREFRELAALEARYRAGGLDDGERADLDRRFSLLTARFRTESRDAQFEAINSRQAALDHRIDQGRRNGSLTRAEANRLRAEFRDLARLEARYRADGLDRTEVADLDRRFDQLSARIRVEGSDRADNRYRR